MRQVSRSVAIVMPEIGFDEDPISPVSRDETVTKRKPKTTMRTAPTSLVPIPASRSSGADMIDAMRMTIPIPTNFMDRSLSVRGTCATPAPAADSSLARPTSRSPSFRPCQIVGRERKRLMIPPAATAPEGAEKADDPSGGHGARAHVEDVGRPDVVRLHVGNGYPARRERALEVLPEELDHRDQDQVGQDAAPAHESRDPGPDDVADAEELGGDLRADGGPVERRGEDLLRRVLPKPEHAVEDVVDHPDAEPGEDGLGPRGLPEPRSLRRAHLGDRAGRRLGAVLGRGPGREDGRARRPFRILERPVLLDDERPAERDHHEDPQEAPENGHQEHALELKVEPQDHDRRHRHAHPEGDGLPG